MPAGVHGKAGFDTRSLAVSIKRLGKLSSTVVAGAETCGECRRNYM
jgi:hypothetical protein